ncbi:arginine repressor [Staphylococcus devriesei]|uniref:Arginine repressor n=1 Tax=Staphylococcus devriesei TaxID=586733 RepID=A0A2K4DI45_9STAP|nr:ArgR family transcriptional regulator [Staphylococcus devriesei]MCE5097113.1 ArgR family transcriptional regulator [Staphylococcus devriesei]PNZ86512.1 ArgR family transcriptional regulator [Staphylococcus devriesei]PTE70399.1 ArgR family transcriptional regulator [Staphylococcus devriesei]PTF04971.1 ArgR family transcriptional regulator [Staphylococcus devriesei]PTF13590.1 ArgR family transcriptional regulator [Staphylococcus devriesei]
MKKSKRLDLILTVVKQNRFYTKEDIANYIDMHFGIRYSVTTIGRDLKELKIFKMPTVGNQSYYKKLDNTQQMDAKTKLEHYYEEEIQDITIKNSYLIIKTSPGFAQCINYFIDQMNIEEVLGTVGGNDTLMVLTSSEDMAKYVHYKLFGYKYA